MPSVKKLPDTDTLVRLSEEGMTNKQIGEKFGVTGEAVRLRLAKEGIRVTPRRPSHARYLPWRLSGSSAHQGHVLARRLRAYSKRQQGLELSATENRLLDQWLRFMEGDNPWGVPLSVHYSRTDAGGFWLEARREGDRDYISPPPD